MGGGGGQGWIWDDKEVGGGGGQRLIWEDKEVGVGGGQGWMKKWMEGGGYLPSPVYSSHGSLSLNFVYRLLKVVRVSTDISPSSVSLICCTGYRVQAICNYIHVEIWYSKHRLQNFSLFLKRYIRTSSNLCFSVKGNLVILVWFKNSK